jgi:replicative DNA helicase
MEIELLKKLQSLITTENIPEEEVLARLKLLVQQADLNEEDHSTSMDLKSFVAPSYQKILKPGYLFNSFDTGFFRLDNEVGFLNPGELAILAGRPGMGITTLLLNMAVNCAAHSEVLFFYAGTAQQVIANRILAGLSGISNYKINRNFLSSEERTQLASYEEQIASLKLFLQDGSNVSLTKLRQKCEQAIQQHNIKLVIIDPLQYLCKSRNRNQREIELAYVCQEMKRMAKDLNICILASSQLSRQVEYRGGDKIPQLSDLRESGAIEQEADKVAFLYRPAYYGIREDEYGQPTANSAELHIAKNSTGPLVCISFKHDTALTHFYESTELTNDFNIHDDRLGEITAIF